MSKQFEKGTPPAQEQIVLKEEAEAGPKAWNKLYFMPAQADRCTVTPLYRGTTTVLT